MLIHIIQLNRKQGKLLLPAFPSNIINTKSEEALQSAIPQIKLIPRGGFWFEVIAESEEEIARFIAFAKAKSLILSYSTRREQREEEETLDLSDYGMIKVEDKAINLGKVIPKAMSSIERDLKKQEEELFAFAQSMKQGQAVELIVEEDLSNLPTPENLFGTKKQE